MIYNIRYEMLRYNRQEAFGQARESSWLLNADEFKLRKEIGNTLKSVVHLADWNGTTVVVKCVKLERASELRYTIW